MVAIARHDVNGADFSDREIPLDEFLPMRKRNLARWPTGAEVFIDEAVAYHKAAPKHKSLGWAMREAKAKGLCLTQPRGGFGTFALQLELMQMLEKEGLADIVPITTDSYTRNERFEQAARGMTESEKAGRSMLNGFPIVNAGVKTCRQLVESVQRPTIVLSGTAMPRLTSEIALAAGFTGYLGSGIAYTVSYTKDVTIEEGIRNYQYLDRLAALYAAHGVDIHRRQPGFLTGTNIPPSIAIITCILDALLAAKQGVTNYGLELGQTLNLIQDAAAIRACEDLVQEYLGKAGFANIFTPVTSLHWMGAWPQDEASCAALVSYGGTLAAMSGAVSVTTKSTHEAIGIPTPKANSEGLRMTRMAIYMAHGVRLDGHPLYRREFDLIGREVRPVVDKVLEMGDGDVVRGTVRAFEAGVLDIPWSPNRYVKSRVMPARDAQGCLRILEPGNMPFPKDVMEFHRDQLKMRAAKERCAFDNQLAVQSVYEISEPLSKLMPFALANGSESRAGQL